MKHILLKVKLTALLSKNIKITTHTRAVFVFLLEHGSLSWTEAVWEQVGVLGEGWGIWTGGEGTEGRLEQSA
jgi:hypothetical protein